MMIYALLAEVGVVCVTDGMTLCQQRVVTQGYAYLAYAGIALLALPGGAGSDVRTRPGHGEYGAGR